MLHKVAEKINGERTELGDDIRAATKEQGHIGVCPECGNNISIKRSKKGAFIGCDGYPECTRAYPLPRGAMIQTTDEVCEICRLPKLKIIRKGSPPQTVCIDPKCGSNEMKNDLGTCPKCGGRIRILYSKSGKRFAGCSNWPECDRTYPLRPTGSLAATDEMCDKCGSPIISVGGRNECISMDCPGRPDAPKKKVGVVKKG